MVIKCNKCDNGNMVILYDRTGLSFYQCSSCDNKRSKYEIEQEEQQTTIKQQDQNSKTALAANKEKIEDHQEQESINKLKEIFESEVYGYVDLKSMLIDIVDLHLKGRLDKPSHTLLIGSAGVAKTFFFECMKKALPTSIFEIIDSSHLSGTGLLSYLNETQKNQTLLFIVMDELDKMDKTQQKKLLAGLESGILKERKFKRYAEIDVSNILFFATANEKDKIYQPLLTRFTTLELPEYSYQEYRMITDNWIKRKCPSNYVALCGILFPNSNEQQRIHIRTIKRVVDLSQCIAPKLDQYLKVMDSYN